MAQGYSWSSTEAYYAELAAQEEAARIAAEQEAARLEAERAAYVARIAATTAAVATPATPVVQTTAPVAAPTGNAFDDSLFAKQFLPSQDTFKWVRTKQDFIDLPTEQRARLVDQSLQQRRSSEKWDDSKYLATKAAAHKALTYMDTGGVAPKAEWLNNDVLDKTWSGMKNLWSAGERKFFTKPEDMAALDAADARSAAADQASLSANTKDVDRRAAFREREAAQLGNKHAIGDKLWGGFKDILSAPGAGIGNVAGSAAPTIAAAFAASPLVAATGVAGAGTALLTGVSALQNAVQAPSDRYQSYLALGPEVFKDDPNFKAMKEREASDAQALSYAAAKLAYGAGSTAVDSAIGAVSGFVGAKAGGAALLQGKSVPFTRAAGVDQLTNAVQTGVTSVQKNVMGQSVNPMDVGDMLGAAAGEAAAGVGPTLLGTAGFKAGSMLSNAVVARGKSAQTPTLSPEATNEQIVRRAVVDTNSPEAAALLEAQMELPAKRTAEQVAVIEAADRIALGKPESVDPSVISAVDPIKLTTDVVPPTATTDVDPRVAKAEAMQAAFAPTDEPRTTKLPDRFWTAQDVLAYASKETSPEAVAQLQSAFQADLSSDVHTKGLSLSDIEALGIQMVPLTQRSAVASMLTEGQVRKSIKDNINAILVNGQMENVPNTVIPRVRMKGKSITFNFQDRPSLTYPDRAAAIQALATDPALQSFLPKEVFVAQQEAAQKQLDKIAAREATAEPLTNVVDTYFAYDKTRETESAVGSAFLNPDGTANATFIKADGSTINVPDLPNMATAKQWMQDKGPSVVVGVEQKNSGQRANLNPAAQAAAEAVLSAEPFEPGMVAMNAMGKAAGMTDVGAAIWAKSVLTRFGKLVSRPLWRDLYSELGSRNAPMDVLRDAAVAAGRADLARTVGEDAAIRARNKASSELHTSGMTEFNIHDIKNDVVKAAQAMSKGGIGASTIENLSGARTAKQRDVMVASKFPTDLRGEVPAGSGSGFAFYRDKTTGNIIDIQAGHVDIGTEVAPPNSERISGTGAPQAFLNQFALQFPDHVKTSLDLADAIVRGNRRNIFIAESQGEISPAIAKALSAHDHYMPLVQLEDIKTSNGRRTATGRSTAAVSPLTQWMDHIDRSVARAYSRGVIRDMIMMAQEVPIPNIMTINAFDAKLSPKDSGSTISNIDWKSDHGITKDNVFHAYIGKKIYALTVHDSVMASNMKAPEFSQFSRDYIIPLLANINRVTSMTRTTLVPGQWAVGAAWDTGLALFNLQGGVGKNLATGEWVVPTKDAVPMWARVMRGVVADMPSVTRDEFRKTAGRGDFGEASPDNIARRFYAEQGAGISLHAATGVDSGGIDPFTGKASMVRGAVNTLAQGVDTIGTTGHVVASAVRFNIFKEVIKLHNDGKLPQTAADMAAFAENNPHIIDAAVRGSKEVLGNFEAIGHSVIIRGLFPFFNASMVGAFRVMPQIVTSPAGLSSVAAVMGIAVAAAAMQMGKEHDADGFDQYTRKAGVWDNGIAFGGLTTPLPHEMRLFANTGTWLAAHSYRMAGGKIDTAHINAKMLRTLVDIMPGLKTAPFENAPLTSALGHLGFPIGTAMSIDSTGREFGALKSNGTYDYDPSAQKFNQVGANSIAPDWTKYNSSNSNLQIGVAKGLAALSSGAISITPDAVQNTQRYLFGTWYRYEDTYEKALLESGGDHSVASRELVAAVFKPFWNEANKNSVRDTYQARIRAEESQTYLASPDPAINSRKTALNTSVADAGKEIAGITSSTGQTRAELDRYMSMYKAQGNMLGYAAAKKQMIEIDNAANIVRARVTNMLEN